MTTDQVPPAEGIHIGDTAPRPWERLAPAGALVFLLTIILGALAIGESSPDSDGPARDIAAYFADHQGGHLANTFLVVLGCLGFLPLVPGQPVAGVAPSRGRHGHLRNRGRGRRHHVARPASVTGHRLGSGRSAGR